MRTPTGTARDLSAVAPSLHTRNWREFDVHECHKTGHWTLGTSDCSGKVRAVHRCRSNHVVQSNGHRPVCRPIDKFAAGFSKAATVSRPQALPDAPNSQGTAQNNSTRGQGMWPGYFEPHYRALVSVCSHAIALHVIDLRASS